MPLLERVKEVFDSGDPTVRTWPLVESWWQPFLLCSLYVYFIKGLGPDLMRYRRPFDLRVPMIVYNFAIVVSYSVSLLALIFYFFTTDGYKKICETSGIKKGHYTYTVSCIAWFLYLLKYIEFADTVFFVLRKKFHLVTNLHVIHHTALPLICWVMLRTERSGFQLIPGGINSFVHIIMYTYYGLAAMGPDVQKTLWWKEYLTLLQMTQFVIILLFMFVVVPLIGCKTSIFGVYMDMFFATLFLVLFYNFYTKTYKEASVLKKLTSSNGVHNHKDSGKDS